MKNKYIRHSHLSEVKFKEIVYFFIKEGFTATKIAENTKISRPTVNRILQLLRPVIVKICEQNSYLIYEPLCGPLNKAPTEKKISKRDMDKMFKIFDEIIAVRGEKKDYTKIKLPDCTPIDSKTSIKNVREMLDKINESKDFYTNLRKKYNTSPPLEFQNNKFCPDRRGDYFYLLLLRELRNNPL